MPIKKFAFRLVYTILGKFDFWMSMQQIHCLKNRICTRRAYRHGSLESDLSATDKSSSAGGLSSATIVTDHLNAVQL
jgi:hypothetical protein